MRVDYLERAKEKVGDIRKLIIGASRRATELAHGAKALVPVESDPEKENRTHLDIALLEIAEGKVTIEHVQHVEQNSFDQF